MNRKRQAILLLSVLFVCLAGYHVYAIASQITWQTGLGIKLPHYTSVIDADNNMYFSQYAWNAIDATQVSFSNFYMGSGTPISSLTVSSTTNITLSKVSTTELYYLSPFNGTQTFSTVNLPANVTIDGVSRPQNYYWTFSNGILTVTNAVSNVDILFTSNALTPDDAVGIAVALFVLAIGVCIGLIFAFRRRATDNE